jgi:ABC-type dipeptide/oligopeptide/nickel transport system permease component
MRFALFLIRRLLAIVVLALAVTAAAFTLFRVAGLRPATIVQIDTQLGPGEPAPVQYLHYLQRMLHGNLGQTMVIGLPVDTALRQALPATLSLIVGGMVLWLVAGIWIGTISARHRRCAHGAGFADIPDRAVSPLRVLLPSPLPLFLAAARVRAVQP